MVVETKSAKILSLRKIGNAMLIVLTIGLFSYLVSYLVSANSDAFTEARRFIIQSPTVSLEFGSNINVRLDPSGYELEFSGTSGNATFMCNVEGSKGKGKVKITLNKIANTWRVKGATLIENSARARGVGLTAQHFFSPPKRKPSLGKNALKIESINNN